MNMGDEILFRSEGGLKGSGTVRRSRLIGIGSAIPETEDCFSDESVDLSNDMVKNMPAYGIFRDDPFNTPTRKSRRSPTILTKSTRSSTVAGLDLEVGNSSSIGSVKAAVDGNMILALERTLFAALNNSWLLAIGGVGLMTIGDEDKKAKHSGMVILCLSMFTALYAFVVHNLRVQQLRRGDDFSYSQTQLWGIILAMFTLLTLGLELYNGILHPYLKRAATVELSANENIFEQNFEG